MGRHPDEARHKPYEIEHLWGIHHEIMRLTLIGMKPKDIAEHLNITPQMVGYTLRSSIVKRELGNMEAARDMDAVDVSLKIKNLAPKAVEVLEELLGSELPNIRYKAAADVLDRSDHSAVRTIKTENVHACFTVDELKEIKSRAKEVGLLIDITPDHQLAIAEGGLR